MPDPQETTLPIIGIAATRIAGGGGPNRKPIPLETGDEQPIPLDDILFAFTKGGVTGVSPLIISSWRQNVSFARATVYIRTKDALYRVGYDSLRAFNELLPRDFGQVSKSVIANLARVEVMDLKGTANRVHTLTYSVVRNELTWDWEIVRVGREFLDGVRGRYGYRRSASVRTLHSGVPPAG